MQYRLHVNRKFIIKTYLKSILKNIVIKVYKFYLNCIREKLTKEHKKKCLDMKEWVKVVCEVVVCAFNITKT